MRPFHLTSAVIALSLIGAIAVSPATAQRSDFDPQAAASDRFRDQDPLTKDEQNQLRQVIRSLSGNERRGWEMINRMLQAERRRAFIAREVRLSANGEETEFWVRCDPARGLRFEGVRPAGVVVLDDRSKLYVYKPNARQWTAQPSMQSRSRSMINYVVRQLLRGNLKATQEGQDTVAGRSADIVRVEPTTGGDGKRFAPSRRFWVDRATGLRVKHEMIRPDGRLLSSSYFLNVDFAPRFRSDDFTPPASAVPVGQDRGRKTEYASTDEARRAGVDVPNVTYLPKGFTLRVIEVMPDRRGKNNGFLTERFGNGLTTLSLVRLPASFPLPYTDTLTGPKRSGFIPPPPGQEGRAYTWEEDGYRYVLFGTLPADELKRIGRSVK